MSQSVFPQSIAELQQVVRAAADTGRPIYVYRQVKDKGINVDVSKLDEIMEIDTANLVATVGPGVKLGTLAGRLAKQGLRFLPADTPFYHEKTVGELFYEGCSNISSLKYGSAKHFLMGSEVVLPTGELLKTGGKTVKNVTGYDFTRFFNSPYTDYGITVKFLLKLLPLPEARKGMAITFARIEEVLAFVKNLKEERLVPSYLLWVDHHVQDFFQNNVKGQLVLLEYDGFQEEVGEAWRSTIALNKKFAGITWEEYEDGQTAAKWGVLYQNTDKYVLTDEYKIAFTRQAEFINAFYEIAKQNGAKAGLFGQVSEGKLNLVFAGPVPEVAFIEEISRAVKQMDGIVSGKYDRLTGKCKTGVLGELEQRAKNAFDPKLILNRQQGVN